MLFDLVTVTSMLCVSLCYFDVFYQMHVSMTIHRTSSDSKVQLASNFWINLILERTNQWDTKAQNINWTGLQINKLRVCDASRYQSRSAHVHVRVKQRKTGGRGMFGATPGVGL